MELLLLRDLVVIFGLSIIVLLICHRVHLPAIVGFLITGVLCGPHGLELIRNVEDVQIFADIGIVLLLFSVGMEFSLKRILQHKRYFLLVGPLQVGLVILMGFVVAQILQRPIGESIFLGFLLSLSSTAIVLRVLQDRFETATSHGKVILGILIFQDIIVIPMMLFTPLLAGEELTVDTPLLGLLFASLFLVIGVFIAAQRLVPKVLDYVARTRSRELFLLTVLVTCFSVAWITSSIGLSLSLGAFLAGLTIADSEYSHEAIGGVLPFQDLFTSFFFITIGMLLDTRVILENPFTVFSLTMGVIIMKFFGIALVTFLLGVPLHAVVLSAFALSQVGEFSFVLAQTGIAHQIATEWHYQLFLAVSILTMALTPTLITSSYTLFDRLLQLPLFKKLQEGLPPLSLLPPPPLEKHVVVIGYGVIGEHLVRSCKEVEIPHIIVDKDPEKIEKVRLEGEPIYFGDATHESVLRSLGVSDADVIAILVNDPVVSARIVKKCRALNSHAFVLVRTGRFEEMKPIYESGADEVVPDEFAASIEIFTRVMHHYQVPRERIDKYVMELRTEGYEILRTHYMEGGARP